jgi:hypothetical protein
LVDRISERSGVSKTTIYKMVAEQNRGGIREGVSYG